MASIAHADGSAIFLNPNGNGTISSLQLRVIPGTTNATSFRVVAQGGNISSLGFFAFSPDLNIFVSPANQTNLPDGDFQLVIVSVSVANNTQAGPKVASIFTLTTSHEQAGEHAGVSMNDVTSHMHLDTLSGTAAFNGLAVTLRRADT